MIVKKSYNIRLYPNKGQANFINKTIGGCKFAYNLCLKSKKYLYKNYGISYEPKMALLSEEYPEQLGSACGVDSSVVEIQSRSTVKQESPLL